MTARSLARPGGPVATRVLHFFWLVDCSGSMKVDGKIQALNHAIGEAIPHMRKAAEENPNATLLVRALGFASKVFWHVGQPTPVEKFEWNDLQADGQTMMGQALLEISQELRRISSAERVLPPVLALITDGQPTDDFDEGLHALMAEPLGQKAVRVAIAIGDDADLDCLRKFIGDPERPPLQAQNPETLIRYIGWISTTVVKVTGGGTSLHGKPVPIPKPPPPSGGDDLW